MASGITATKADFDKGYQDTSDVKGQLDDSLRRLQGNIEAAAAGWHGPAGDALQALMVRFNEQARACSNVLQDLGDKINSSGQSIDAHEEEQRSQISNITGALG